MACPSASQCTACSYAKSRISAVCVSACAANEAVSNGQCTCPGSSSYVDSNNTCQMCNPECAGEYGLEQDLLRVRLDSRPLDASEIILRGFGNK